MSRQRMWLACGLTLFASACSGSSSGGGEGPAPIDSGGGGSPVIGEDAGTGGGNLGGGSGSGSSSGGSSGSGSGGSSSGSSGSGGSGSGSSGSGSGGGSGGSSGSSSGSGSSGGASPTDGGLTSTNGVSKCGAPLDATDPTATSVAADGPLTVTSYTTGLPSSPDYKSLTAFYPSNGTGPFVVVMISPGLTEILQYLQPWAQRFASHGYVAVFVEANDTSTDSEAVRATGLWSAINAFKGENTRTGSPLLGKLSNCIVTSGHSLGGGASLTIANTHPNDIKGALGFNPYDPTQNMTAIVVPTLIETGQSDTTAPPAQHGRRQYDSIPATVTKEYIEISGGNHQAALFPGTLPGQYALSWIKFTVDGDARYRPFLNEASSGLSDFATTLP